MKLILPVPFAVLGCAIASAAEGPPSPFVTLTDRYAPLLVQACIDPGLVCRSARIGMREGRVVVSGDLTKDEALEVIIQNAGHAVEEGLSTGHVHPTAENAVGHLFRVIWPKSPQKQKSSASEPPEPIN